MKTKYFLLSIVIISLAAAFVSCSDKDELSAETTMPVEKTVNPFYVSYDEALEKAVNHLNASKSSDRVFSKDEVLDHTEFLTKDNRRLLTRAAGTAADSVDVRFHVINFEDGGFALVSADSRTTPIYAFSETGNLDIEDFSENPGLEIFMDYAASYYSEEICEAKEKLDSIKVWVEPGDTVYVNGVACYCITTSETDSVPHLVQSDWHQDYPFNTYCLSADNERISAGCGPVAVVLIMSVHKWPIIFEFHTVPDTIHETVKLPWNEILKLTDYTDKQTIVKLEPLYKLIRAIGYYSDVDYWHRSSSAKLSKLLETFKKFNYTTSQIIDFNADSIIWSLKKKQPVCIRGQKSDEDSIGHVWVISGYRRTKTFENYYRISSPDILYLKKRTSQDVVYFCNVGQTSNGIVDGYYLDVFNFKANIYYKHKIRMAYDIHPNISPIQILQ